MLLQRAVRNQLVKLTKMEGSAWRNLPINFSPDGHVSIDMGLESKCGSIQVCVEADGGCGWVVLLESVAK